MLRKDKKEVVEEEGEIVTRCWWWWYCWPSLLTMSVSTHLSFSPLSFVVPRVPYYRVRRKEREMIRLEQAAAGTCCWMLIWIPPPRSASSLLKWVSESINEEALSCIRIRGSFELICFQLLLMRRGEAGRGEARRGMTRLLTLAIVSIVHPSTRITYFLIHSDESNTTLMDGWCLICPIYYPFRLRLVFGGGTQESWFLINP